MDPSEVEFLAEKEVVKIIPNFSLDKVYLIGVSNAALYVQVTIQTVKLLTLKQALITPLLRYLQYNS